MTHENTYWTFSAAAQAVGAFAALLLAAYALVHGLMDSVAKEDDSLAQIHRTLKRKYHIVLSCLAVATAFAVLSCLLVVYLNAYEFRGQTALMIIAAFFVILSVGGGVFFVLLVVDPRKYERTASDLAQSITLSHVQGGVPSEQFFKAFVDVERRLRELYERHLSRVDILQYERSRLSPRQMLESLVVLGVIPSDRKPALLDVIQQRNLLFHGHIEDVAPAIVDQARSIADELARIP